MSSDDKQMPKDDREACKYGANCYQKNPDHRKKFKHPKKRKSDDSIDERKEKKTKQEVKISNDVSDSEESANGNVDSLENQEKSVNTTSVESFDPKLFIKEKFLVQMPGDFYEFWEFAKGIKPNKPEYAFNGLGLTLVGPFDVLANKFHGKTIEDEKYLIHWRYYHDVPEFQTVIKGDDKTGYHIGYFRDIPSEMPVLLASNCAEKDGNFTIMGDNIFAAVYLYLEEILKSADPFKKMQLAKLQNQLKKKAQELNLELTKTTKSIQQREKKIVSKTFNGIGLVVPYDKKTELGYRPLTMNDKQLRNCLNKLQASKDDEKLKLKYLSELEPVLNFATIALDECDFGTGVELGWNLINHGISFLNSTIARFLTNSYNLLNRSEYARIAEIHFGIDENRRTGTNLSIL